jgi:Domain of unknown function (DUF222)/HNH endonuclease
MFDRDLASIPAGLDDLEPGPELARLLEEIDVERVSPYDRIVVLRAEDRMVSHHQARKYQAMAAVADAFEEDHPSYRMESAAAEIRAALCLTRRATDTELSFALELCHRLPQVWSALVAGAIDYRRARTITLGTVHLTPGTGWEVVERILPDAPRLTSGQLRARLDRLGVEADPELARRRYERSVGDRRVVTEPTSDGTGNLLGLDMAPHRVAAASRRINHLARSLKRSGETRTMDQLRADVFLDLLTGKANGAASGGGVELQIPLDTLTGLAENPAELAGYGTVIADIARQVAADQRDSTWRYAVTDPETGRVLYSGITRRRPTAALRRSVEARDRTCVFPGCRMPAVDCDLDHTTRWADGGATTEENQAPLCRHDHSIKDVYGWSYQRLSDGRYRWTSRLGHSYYTSGRSP